MTNITVSDVQGEVDYKAAMKEFGIESMEPYIDKMKKDKDLPVIFRRGIVFGHRDFGRIYDAIKNKKKFSVLTGANPSMPLHLGNKMFLDQALYFQKKGAHVFIPISDDETYVFKKSDDLEKALETAYKQVIPDILGLGFKPKKTHIFISTQDPRVYKLAVKLSTKTTFSTLKAIFGFTNETNPGQIFYGVVQSAHILYPQLKEFGGPHPVIVSIGIDQDPYMRLVRDIAPKCGFVKPSSTNHKFMMGLQGGKMSGSKPETCIFLTDTPAVARKKIQRAFSGGGGTLEEHREKGGNPDVDVACQYLYQMFEESDKKIEKIFDGYRSGTMTTGEVKQYLIKKVTKFLKDYQRQRKKMEKKVDDFILK